MAFFADLISDNSGGYPIVSDIMGEVPQQQPFIPSLNDDTPSAFVDFKEEGFKPVICATGYSGKRKREDDTSCSNENENSLVPQLSEEELNLIRKPPSQCTETELSKRKRAKNRLAAQESRARRKKEELERRQVVDALQMRVEGLAERNGQLVDEVSRLSSLNAQYLKEIAYLKKVVHEASPLAGILSRFEGILPDPARMSEADKGACGLCVHLGSDGSVGIEMCASCSEHRATKKPRLR